MAADIWRPFGRLTAKELEHLERIAKRLKRGETLEDIYRVPPLGLTWADMKAQPSVTPRRKRERPHWAEVRKVAFKWMEENGSPLPHSGEQAKLERHIETHLTKRKVKVAESTIRNHVVELI